MKKLITLFLLTILIGCDLPQADKPSPENKPEIMASTPPIIKSEPELIADFKTEWDAVVLTKAEDFNMQVKGFPKYETYLSELDKTLEKISSLTKVSNETFPKLEKLRLKLIDSKKYKDAQKNFLMYGQPIQRNDITYPCESYLRQNLNDPGSLDIIDTDTEGQSKKGWVVWIKYRAKNGFGALVLQVGKFEVQYNATNKEYTVINAQL